MRRPWARGDTRRECDCELLGRDPCATVVCGVWSGARRSARLDVRSPEGRRNGLVDATTDRINDSHLDVAKVMVYKLELPADREQRSPQHTVAVNKFGTDNERMSKSGAGED